MSKQNLRNTICGLVVLSIVLMASYFRVLEGFELETLDLRFRLRGERPQNPDIVIIEIADDSLEKIGRWPFDRAWHAQLIEVLALLGVKQIGLDIIFTEEGASDHELIASSERAGNVYFPLTFPISPPLLPELEKVAKGTGHINIIPDIDGKRRKIPLFLKHEGGLYPQMAAVMAADYLNVPLENIDIPLNEHGEIFINYAGRWRDTFTHYSYVDILTSYAQMRRGEEPFVPLGELKGKICFVGLTATGTHDLNPIPLEGRFPMVGVQVNILNSIIQGDFIKRATREANIIILLLLVLLAAAAVTKMRPWLGVFSVSLVMMLYASASFLLFKYSGLWIDVFMPLAVISFGYLGFVFLRYLNTKRAKDIMEHELEIARKIQSRFLPQAYPKIIGMEVAARMIPARKIGGDFYDFVRIDRQKLGVLIGDVSGKGVPAALYMAMVIANFRSGRKLQGEANRVLEKMNSDLVEGVPGGTFASALYLILDAEKGTAVFSNAGHMPLVSVKSKLEPSNSIESEISPRERTGLPLGIHADTVYNKTEIKLESDEALVLYTDGLVESQNRKGEFFGEGRLKELIKDKAFLGAKDMVDTIIEAVGKFSKGLPQYDDLTVVVIKRNEKT